MAEQPLETSSSQSWNTSVTDDYQYYNYYEIDSMQYNVEFLYMSIIGVIGVLGNSFVTIVVVAYTKMTKNITGLLILNQTVIDLVNSLLVIANNLVFYFVGLIITFNGWETIWAEVYCRLVMTQCLQYGTMLSSTLSLVVINFERYLSIVHPFRHKNLTIKQFAVPAIVTVWLAGPIYCFLWGVPSTFIEDGFCWSYDFRGQSEWRITYAVNYFLVMYGMPLLAMVYFYSRILLSWQHRIAKNKTSDIKKNLIKTMFIVTIAFVVCYTFDMVNWLLYVLGIVTSYQLPLYLYSALLLYFNCCINPFIYIFNYREFQKGVQRMFCRSKVGAANSSG